MAPDLRYRRAFLRSVACGALGVALAATAQMPPSASRPRRVLWLGVGASDPPDEVKQVDDALAELGWIVGQNLLIDRRDVSFENLASTVQEFVNAKVDLIATNGTAATLAAKNATSSIPILMGAGDPVASGLVSSLARPGGNVTGFAILSWELRVKRLSLIRELLPRVQRVGELEASDNPSFATDRKRIEEAYQSLGVEPIFIDTTRFAGKYDDMLAEVIRRRAQALNIIEDALYEHWIPQVFSAAMTVSLPTIVNKKHLLETGALLSYEIDEREFPRRVAVLFDKLLRGAKPADLPVEQPTKFILGVNLKTARALGITIPQPLLQRADKVIQ